MPQPMICFEPPFVPEEICFAIPVLVRSRPEPPHWMSGKEIDSSWVKDLSILATISSLASELSTEVARKAMKTAVESSVQPPKLKGLKINFKS